MENPSSPLDTLRQLKEMLDAGALTPTEFEALKQRLVFTPAAPGPVVPAATTPDASGGAAFTPPVAPALPASAAPLAAGAPDAALSQPNSSVFSGYSPPGSPLPAHGAEAQAQAQAFEPALGVAFMPNVSADSQVAPGDSRYLETEPLADDDAPDFANAPAKRNSLLGLILAIGAVLVFLAVVAYLGLNRPTTDEHISSISQTAADSLNTTIETGPQAAPLPTTTAAPETVRVAPANPAPALPSRAELDRRAAAVRDSAAAVASPVASDSVGRQ
ncbi:MAG: SHOCT domain-containing protein [Bacteroidota bacterium]|nr:SHOCT domain-containing protein [Bacteroidota bacterium]